MQIMFITEIARELKQQRILETMEALISILTQTTRNPAADSDGLSAF